MTEKIEIAILLNSLKFSKLKYDNNTKYDTYEARLVKLASVDETIRKARALRDGALSENDFDREDWSLILESLTETKANYLRTNYPTDKLRQEQLGRATSALQVAEMYIAELGR